MDEEVYKSVYDPLIGRTKGNLSQLAGRDVGTPYTVDFILGILARQSPLQGNPTREELIHNYLFNNERDDGDDKHGCRFGGELMRWAAQLKGVSPREIVPDTILRDQFYKAHWINPNYR